MRRRRRRINTAIEFKKSQIIDKELIDKASLWILRIILNLGGHREFIDKDGDFSKENICYFLDLGEYGEMDQGTYKRAEPLNILKEALATLEEQKIFTTSKILAKNITQISNLMQLNRYEEQILEFIVLIKQYELLDDAVSLLGCELNTTQVKRALSVILNIPKADIDKAFSSNSKLSKSSLVTLEKGNSFCLDRKLESISDDFLDNLLNLDEDITVMIKDSVKPCSKSELRLKDYKHLSKDINILVEYLKSVIASKQIGANILFYGLPGTGKTELTKVLATDLKTKLFEVSYTDENDEPIDGIKRLQAYKSAQALLASKKTLLMYDEAEDIFESGGGWFFSPPQRQKDKAWINRVLETNTIPTIWITNNIDSIDNAIVRRFDMCLEIPIPAKSKREEIIKNYSNNLLDKQTIKKLAENEDIAPALITTTAKVISMIDAEDSTEAFTHLLNNTLKAQGHREIKKYGSDALPNVYDPQLVNTTMDLVELASGIKETGNARLCLYGVPGTGKSAFGKYVSEILNKPLLLKKGSDLISMYVGGTEQNIAAAFQEAIKEDAVLVFDEVDSFLADRSQAKQSWEVTQVNEMLVQMENFDGVFIATTNLMDNLDKASLRRFDLKLEFGYLEADAAWKMFLSYARELKLSRPSSSYMRSVKNMKQLTPGDFAAVVRQNRFSPIKSIIDFISRLEDEISVKNSSTNKVMGFLGS